jgi:hypothetical protein
MGAVEAELAAASGDGPSLVKAAATSTTSSFENMMRSMQQQQAAFAQQVADLKPCFLIGPPQPHQMRPYVCIVRTLNSPLKLMYPQVYRL